MMQGRKFSHEASDSDDVEPLSPDEQTPNQRRKKSKNNKRRFSDEQVRSLETIFESETKLEPRKKVQVARELGLQPRQVAIWFQNKRARWKSKEIEKNYRNLKANYDNLKARYEDVRKEKESLCEQLQKVRSVLEKSHGKIDGCDEAATINRQNEEILAEQTAKSSSLQEEMDQQGGIHSDDEKGANMAYMGQDEPELLNLSENLGTSIIVPPMRWCSFDAAGLFDQSSTHSHWWDSWT